MIPAFRYFLLASAAMLGPLLVKAQVCSITLQNDTMVCQGNAVTLVGPAGFPNYLWSNGAITPSITVGSTGNYELQVSYSSGQLVTNGNFSAGNTGFTTQFNLNNNLNIADGTYWIATNAAGHHPQFSGTGNGQFLLANSGWPSALWNVWCQDVVVCPEQTYTLSYRARTVSNATPARLQWWINGVPTGPEQNLPLFNQGWQTLQHTWTSPAGVTAASICLRVMSGDGVGNDFGLDDISMQGVIVLRDAVQVNVTPLPPVDLGPDQTLCFGETLPLDVSVPGGTYLWNNGSTLPTLTVDQAGTYSVTVTANACSATDAVTIAYNSALALDLGPDRTLCAGETTVLDAFLPGGTSYLWQDGSTGATYTVSAPGTYSVTATRNGCSANASVNVDYNPLPVVDLGPDLTRCDGETATFNATTPGATYLWQDGSTAATLTAGAAGTYSVTVTVDGCSTTDAVQLNVTPLPVVDLGPPQTVCPGTAVLLNATVAGGSYVWQDGSTAPTFSATQPGTYTVTATANGCSTTASAQIAHFALPVVDLGPDVTVCAGTATTFTANIAGATNLWSTGSTAPAISPTTAGIYWVDVTRDGCTVRDSVSLAVTPLPIVDLGAPPSVCPGATATVNATQPGGSYLWSTGATTGSTTLPAGTHSITVTVAGCSTTASITVGSHVPPTVDLGPDLTLCSGETAVLNAANPGATFLWSTGATTPTLAVNASGTYSVTVTDGNGCTGTDAASVTVVVPTQVELGPDVVGCAGDVVVLDATIPGATYLWNTGATSPTLSVSTSGTYSVVVTQGNCTVTDAVVVDLLPAPALDLGPDVTLCPGDAVTLNATSPGASYLWSTGATTPTLAVNTAGNFSVTVTNAAGCSSTDAVTVAVITPGAVELGPDTAICTGTTLLLDAQLPGATYLWNTSATTPSLSVTTAGTYSVQVTQGNCSVTDAIVVTLLPAPVVDLGPNVQLCAGQQAVLDATLPGATYLWQDGSTAATFTATQAGSYSVTVTVDGCSAFDAVQVGITPLPSVNLGNDVQLCPGATATFNAGTPGGTYLWHDGSTQATYSTTVAGPVSVTVTVAGCSASGAATVQLVDGPQPFLGNDTTLCVGATLLLNVTEPGASYLWDDGSNSATRTITAAGTYWVRLERNSCVASDTLVVEYFSPTALDLGADVTLCQGNSTIFSTGLGNATHLWSTGATGPSITVSTSGTYWVDVLVAGCAASDTVRVEVITIAPPDLGPDRTVCADEPLTLSVVPGGANVLWSTGSTDPSIVVTSSGIYGVTLSQAGCSTSGSVVITVRERVTALDLPTELELCPGNTVGLDAGVIDGATFLWSDGSTDQRLLVSEPGIYSVAASGQCVNASATVEVRPGDCEAFIFVPNAFTPDGDGINDVFLPSVQGPVVRYRLEVFNRRGQLIHTTDSVSEGWDGQLDGIAAPDGIYIWAISYKAVTARGVDQQRLVGHLSLLR